MSKVKYFAYGSDMNTEQMQRRCPSAIKLGTAKLTRTELIFAGHVPSWMGGVVSLERTNDTSNSCVHGVVWEMDEDHYEQLVAMKIRYGYNMRTTMYVRLGKDTGEMIPVMVFIQPENTKRNQPSDRYVLHLYHARLQHDLPIDDLMIEDKEEPSATSDSPLQVKRTKTYILLLWQWGGETLNSLGLFTDRGQFEATLQDFTKDFGKHPADIKWEEQDDDNIVRGLLETNHAQCWIYKVLFP